VSTGDLTPFLSDVTLWVTVPGTPGVTYRGI
jgi:hypothetical protein